MIYTETSLRGAYVVDLQKIEDSRGFFAYLFEAKEAEQRGLATKIVQIKLSYNNRKGTLRGMHLQLPPAAEVKLVRCVRGAVHDVIVDYRKDSPTYLKSFAVELSADNHRALYVPALFAHGYQTLRDKTETSYQVGEFYTPGVESGLMYNDARLGLKWPLPVAVISDKDLKFGLLADREAEVKKRMSL